MNTIPHFTIPYLSQQWFFTKATINNLKNIPVRSGVYIIASGKETNFTPLYVGSSVNLNKRVYTHSVKNGAITKLKLETNKLALVLYLFEDNDLRKKEFSIIYKIRPKYNVQHNIATNLDPIPLGYKGDLIKKEIKRLGYFNTKIISELGKRGFIMTDVNFSNKIYGVRDRFTDPELKAISKILKIKL